MSRTNLFNMFFSAMLAYNTSLEAKILSVEIPENYAWNGLNPFFQPAHTLNYYGSGDVDNNCQINHNDLDSLEKLVSAKATSNYRADINGDGKLTNDDIIVLREYLDSTAVLPAHWNSLTKEQKINWLNCCLKLDITSLIPSSDEFVCGNFSLQFYCNFSYFGQYLAHTTYTGGGTIFNIPVYKVSIPGHALNAVLVGDDPLKFDNWCFIEPQNFKFVDPVKEGKAITFMIPTYIVYNGIYGNEIINGTRTAEGWTVNKIATGFLTQRSQPPLETNYIDMLPSWNPMIIKPENSAPLILFEKLDQLLPPTTSIHIASIINDSIVAETPVVFDKMAARLLDAQVSPSGKLHLFWRGTKNFRAASFTGVLNLQSKNVEDISEYTSAPLAKAGRLSISSDESLNAIWLNDLYSQDTTILPGINQNIIVQGNWSKHQSISAFNFSFYSPYWTRPLLVNYVMDMATFKGDPVVLSVPHSTNGNTSEIYVHFPDDLDQNKNVYALKNDTPVSGAQMAIDHEGTIHCIYWAKGSSYWTGKVLYAFFRDNRWSEPVVTDSSTVNRCTDIVVNKRNDLLTSWEKVVSDKKSVLCTRVKTNGSWQPVEIFDPQKDQYLWYPRITPLHDTNYIVTWESHGKYKAEVQFKQFSYSTETNIKKISINTSAKAKNISVRFRKNELIISSNFDYPSKGTITILDITGRSVFRSEINNMRQEITVPCPVGQGFYFVKIRSGKDTYIQKINTF